MVSNNFSEKVLDFCFISGNIITEVFGEFLIEGNMMLNLGNKRDWQRIPEDVLPGTSMCTRQYPAFSQEPGKPSF